MNPFRRLAHRSAWLALGLAASALGLAGCSSTDKPKPTPLESFSPSIAASAVWQARLSGVDFPLVIQARADHFVAAGQDGTVLALNADNGQELWRGSAGAPLSAGVGYDGRFAAVVTRANELVVFEGGQERWRKRVSGRVLTAPLVAGERVFVLRADRGVQAFDALDGRPLWTYQRPGEALLLAQGGVLAAYRNVLIVGQGSRLAALDPLRGTLRWETAIATPRGTNEVERLSELVGPVLRTGDTLCVRAFQAAVGCADAARGVLTWSRPNAGVSAVGGDADLLVGADATGRITTWRTPTGDVAWTHDRLLYRELSAPLLVGPVLIVGDLEGQVHFLARQDGATLQRVPTDGTAVVGAPVLSGTTVLVATRGGGLHAFRPQ